MENFSNKIRKRLSEVGKSQRELAAYLGVSDYGLSKMISRGTFKSDNMLRIAKFLEVDINFFGLNYKEKSENVGLNEAKESSTDVEYLKQVIATKDEVIRAKDEIIATLREKLKT